MAYKNPLPTVDIIIEHGGKIALVRRRNEPFKGFLCLPGGFVGYGETVEAAAVREAEEETSLKVKTKEILGVYSDPARDPRHHTLTIVFVASAISGRLKAKDDAMDAEWVDADKINTKSLAFDHGKIISDYRKWLGVGGTYLSSK